MALRLKRVDIERKRESGCVVGWGAGNISAPANLLLYKRATWHKLTIGDSDFFLNWFFLEMYRSGLPPLTQSFKYSGPGSSTLTRKQQLTIARNKAKALQLQRLRGLGSAPLATRGFRGGYGNKGEKKFFDINTATYQANTTGSFTLLFIPVLGTDFNARIGRKTRAVSLYIRGRVSLEDAISLGAGNIAGQMIRMIIFVDLQPNGAAPAVTDLLNEALPSSQLNANNRDRFLVLKDKQYTFDPILMNTTTPFAAFNTTSYPVKCYKKINVETIFNATNGGTIADITSGAIYMFWIGSSAAGVNTDANAIVSTRVRYLDA